MNVGLEIYWSNNPMPLDENVENPNITVEIPVGVMIANPTSTHDILEGYYINPTTFNNLSNQAYIPEDGKIYVDVNTNLTYRWSGMLYVSLGGSGSFNFSVQDYDPLTSSVKSSIEFTPDVISTHSFTGTNEVGSVSVSSGDISAYFRVSSGRFRLYPQGTKNLLFAFETIQPTGAKDLNPIDNPFVFVYLADAQGIILGYANTSPVSPVTISDGNYFELEIVGDTVNVYLDDVLIRTVQAVGNVGTYVRTLNYAALPINQFGYDLSNAVKLESYLPVDAKDGDIYRVINNNGTVFGKSIIVGDYLQVYGNVTGIIITRLQEAVVYPVTSVNGQVGDVVLNYADVGADPAGNSESVRQDLQLQINNLQESKLDVVDYVQHFKGVFSSFSALTTAIPVASDGDYAHIDSGAGFDRMAAIWDSSDIKWVVQDVGLGSNTDEVPEGSTNLYFTSDRVRQTTLTGLNTTDSSNVVATDTLLQAIGKLQAKSLAPPTVTWVNANTLAGYVKHANVTAATTRVQLAVINGLVWMRGHITLSSSVNVNTVLFSYTDSRFLWDNTYQGSVADNQFTYDKTFHNNIKIQDLAEFRLLAKQIGTGTAGNITNTVRIITAVSITSDINYAVIEPVCLGIAKNP